MELFDSKRGGKKLSFDGYIYNVDRNYITHSTWRCERSRWNEHRCLGRAKKVGTAVTIVQEHNHQPDLAKIQSDVAKANLYKAAREGTTSTRTLVSQAVQGLPDAAVAKLPSLKSMGNVVRSNRARTQMPRPNPASLSELEIPDEFTLTLRNEQFLLFDSGSTDDQRIVVFATPKNLEVLKKCKIWSADGTFKTCPVLFNQLWVIHGFYRGKFLPLLFALMPLRKTSCYERVLNVLVENGVDSPDVLIQDFEMAEMNAFQNIFPEIQIRGCWFHFAQCIYRKIQEFGQARNYARNQDFHNQLKMFMALPFARLEDVVTYYEAASDHLTENNPELTEFCDRFLTYMESTWIGVAVRNRRRNPLYQHSLWNLHDSVLENLPRTNNGSEGWNHGFQSSVGSSHPTIFKFIDSLLLEQGRTDALIIKLDSGEPQAASQKKYLVATERISNVIEEYDTYMPIEFLTSISHNFNL